MANAQQKLVLTQPRIIPLNKLERREANVREVKKGLTLDAVADESTRPNEPTEGLENPLAQAYCSIERN